MGKKTTKMGQFKSKWIKISQLKLNGSKWVKNKEISKNSQTNIPFTQNTEKKSIFQEYHTESQATSHKNPKIPAGHSPLATVSRSAASPAGPIAWPSRRAWSQD